MGQIYNVLIILAITFLMAVALTVLVYFADLVPSVVTSNGTSVSANLLALQAN